MKKQFDIKTISGSKRILAILVTVILVSSCIAQMISSDFGKIKIEKISIDPRGAALTGELYYPAYISDEEKLPAVVVVPGAGVINYSMRSYAEELAKAGYVVFNLNPYGSSTSETPVNNENDQGIKEYNIFGTPMGTLDAVNYLRTVEYVDQDNIGVTGHSQGSRRTGYAALMDCGYYTINDLKLNILHDKLGITFNKDELEEDADDLAKQNLSSDQLQYYEDLAAQAEQLYETRIKSILLVGSQAQYVNPTQTVLVAGYEVTRSCQTNLGIINGSYDFGYVPYNNSDELKNAWYIPLSENVAQGGYYRIDDLSGTSKVIGNFRKDTVNSDPALEDAIDHRNLRVAMQTGETHSKNFFSKHTTAMAIDFFNQTLHHNSDVLYTSDSSIHFVAREIFNGISLIAMVLSLFPIISILENTAVAAALSADHLTAYSGQKNNKVNLVIGIGTVLLNALAIYLVNGRHPLINHKWSTFFPLMITCWAPIQFVEWLAVMGAILVVIYCIMTKGWRSLKDFFSNNVWIGGGAIGRSLYSSLVFIGFGYLAFSVIQYLFLQDFRFWQVAFESMKVEYWVYAARYCILIFPFMLASNIATNFLSNSLMLGKPKWLDVLLTVLINIAGVYLLCCVSVALDYSGTRTSSISSFMLTYGAILFMPLMTLVNRRAFQMTNNVWIGTFASMFLMAWMLVSVSGLNANYVPQNWIGVFFGA